MSGPPSGGGNPPVRSGSMGGMNGIMSMPSVSRPVDAGLGGTSAGTGQPGTTMSTAALNQIVSIGISAVLCRYSHLALLYPRYRIVITPEVLL